MSQLALDPEGRRRRAPSRASRRPRFRRAQSRFGLLLTLPALALFAALILFPFVRSFGLAFFESTLLSPEPEFVGLANFRRLFSDPSFTQAWTTTILYVLVTTAATVGLGFLWALVLNQAFTGRTLVRSATILPWILPSTVTAFLWAWIFNGQFGLLNAALEGAGLIDAPVVWLASPAGALTAVILAKVWLSTPVAMSFILAGLQSISPEEVDAAQMDGCQGAGIVRHVVLPHVAPTVAIVFVLQAMANLQQIDTILAMTRGGPARATTVLSVEVYQRAFQDWNIGLASAIGVVWFFTIAIPAGVYLRSIFRRV